MTTKNSSNSVVGSFNTVYTDVIIPATASSVTVSAPLTVTGNIIPSATDTYALGIQSARWNPSYIERSITTQNNTTCIINGTGTGFSVGTSQVQINFTVNPGGGVFDAGSFKLKFPQRGLYRVDFFLQADLAVGANGITLVLKENAGNASSSIFMTTAQLSNSVDPFFGTLFWNCNATTDRVGLFGTGTTTITNVYVTYGQVSCLEQYN